MWDGILRPFDKLRAQDKLLRLRFLRLGSGQAGQAQAVPYWVFRVSPVWAFRLIATGIHSLYNAPFDVRISAYYSRSL